MENHWLRKEGLIEEGDRVLERIAQTQLREYGRLMAYYKSAMMEIETKFNVLNEEFSLQNDRNPIASIHSRLKRPFSIKEKLERKGLPMTVEAIERTINDVAGIRVVCSFPDDVYLLADALLSQDDVKLIARKDYIAQPKPNGYRSLHLIVEIPIFLAHAKRSMRVEIQLRTIAMDCWASLEHQMNYKKDIPKSVELTRELWQCAELSAQLDARMAALRREMCAQLETPSERDEDTHAKHAKRSAL